MRLKKDYVLRQMGGTWVILPLADATVQFSGILTLNDAGAMLWKVLEDTCDKNALGDGKDTCDCQCYREFTN